jgi:hercynylcysteine S-oxide lyase
MTTTKVNNFGHNLLKDFFIDPKWRNLNHGTAFYWNPWHRSLDCTGSFGTYPRVVRDKLREYQDLTEAQPDAFLRYDFKVRDKSNDKIGL